MTGGGGSAGPLILPPGRGRTVAVAAQRVTFKVTGEHSRAASTFEVVVPPGFDVGAHTHTHSEELFYVIEGELEVLAFEPLVRTPDHWREWESAAGERAVRAGPGTLLFVPPGCPHAFANSGPEPARVLFQAAPPPAHERYFEELLDILAAGGEIDHSAIAALRLRYDVQQLTPLRYDPPAAPVDTV
ncbi:cupin domain-containing protein [Streptomyces sp. NPDC093252]|uniref:cupin domain-containing protein n=1 Tax=Streptomyces sp. NPDC093252 TaxID=3154980 RepID=UPI003430B7D9